MLISCNYANASDIFNHIQLESFNNIMILSEYTYGTNDLTLITKEHLLKELQCNTNPDDDNDGSLEYAQLFNIIKNLPENTYINLEN